MGIRPVCPPVTLSNELPECEVRRQQYEEDKPHTFLSLNLEVYFFNDQATLAEAKELCASLGYRFPTVEELLTIDFSTPGGKLLCPMLVWATTVVEGRTVNTFAFVAPMAPFTNIVIPVAIPSKLCRAYGVCISNLE
ncbi:hypothetical protein [Metabacillus arenae]|uniref:Uncharacterized protein n=1 Tax=Metabacillus arenae TaxID=2771434 RepID=A0A926NIF8_9BACI|nr:hypothetical protein [Metabacillus arenae]MBD1381345.1 hypothetical protein [Metabacillus arenae]